jgi:5-hydroxyisourate hydrolase
MLSITTHVLDLTSGSPAAGVAVTLESERGGAWASLGNAATDADGRVREGFSGLPGPGRYRLTFATGAYFVGRGVTSFHPEVVVTFEVRETRHHHVPLLLSPFGYSTYRGS